MQQVHGLSGLVNTHKHGGTTSPEIVVRDRDGRVEVELNHSISLGAGLTPEEARYLATALWTAAARAEGKPPVPQKASEPIFTQVIPDPIFDKVVPWNAGRVEQEQKTNYHGSPAYPVDPLVPGIYSIFIPDCDGGDFLSLPWNPDLQCWEFKGTNIYPGEANAAGWELATPSDCPPNHAKI